MRCLGFVGVVCLTMNFCAVGYAQILTDVKEQFSEALPKAKFYEKSGVTSMIYGTPLATGSNPLESANSHLSEWSQLYADDIGELIPEVKAEGNVLSEVMRKADGTPKFYSFRYSQHLGSTPVFRSGIGFLVRNESEFPVVMAGFDLKELDGVDISAPSGEASVSEVMISNVASVMDQSIFGHNPDESNHLHNANNPGCTCETCQNGEVNSTSQEDSTPSVMDESLSENTGMTITNFVPRTNQLLVDAVSNLAGVASAVQDGSPERIDVSEAEYVIWAGINNEHVEPRLAISFIAERGSIRTVPEYKKFLIVADAATGEVLLSETQIIAADIDGSVEGRATDGLATLECDPEVPFFLPYVEVSVNGGNTVFADANGQFTVPHDGDAPVTVTSRLRGQFFEVFDESLNGAIPEISSTVTPPGPVNFLFNPSNTDDLMTANVNTYLESNIVRDFTLSFEPNFPVIANQLFFDINTNIASSCNAFYDGSSINFFQAGGGCNNTAVADVIHHEYGHHLVAVTGNGQSQFGEGSGDVLGVLLQDEPILAQGFSGNCNAGIRNANNNIQYPCVNGASGHFCGQLISGCVWDLRNELIITEPNSYIETNAALFIGMLIVRGDTQPGNAIIDPSITVIYLELDDDDGNIGNGTPHFAEIDAAFSSHNMDPPPLDLLVFEFPRGLPELLSPRGGLQSTVTISDFEEQYQPGTAKVHVDRGLGEFEEFDMPLIGDGIHEAIFPQIKCGNVVNFFFSAETTAGNTFFNPPVQGEFYTAIGADSLSERFVEDFENSSGWTVTGDAVDGQWEAGVPVGGGVRGDPPVDADGSGSCYLTDNVAGNSDVDDGSTILTSPIFDATPTQVGVPLLSYSRWYDNVFGAEPNADIFVVEISNDAGSTWVPLETVGPTGPGTTGGWVRHMATIPDFLIATDQMQVRFIASDLDGGSVVEAGIDDFSVFDAVCNQVFIPDALTVVRGEHVDGSLTDLRTRNDQVMEFESDTETPRVGLFIFDAESISPDPSTLLLVIESRRTNTNRAVVQRVELFNYETNSYEVVNSRNLSSTDSSVFIRATGDVTRFVEEGTQNVRTRVRYSSGGDDSPFGVEIDFMRFRTTN